MKKQYPAMKARALVRRFGTRDPFTLAEALGIKIVFRDDFRRQKGAFKLIMRTAFIFLNANLSFYMQRMVCAHELGHALLHRDLGKMKMGLVEFEILDVNSAAELEANLFAGEMLLDEDDLVEYVRDGWDLLSIAKAMNTNINLLLLRVNAYNAEHDMKLTLPEMPRRDFLGVIDDGRRNYESF